MLLRATPKPIKCWQRRGKKALATDLSKEDKTPPSFYRVLGKSGMIGIQRLEDDQETPQAFQSALHPIPCLGLVRSWRKDSNPTQPTCYQPKRLQTIWTNPKVKVSPFLSLCELYHEECAYLLWEVQCLRTARWFLLNKGREIRSVQKPIVYNTGTNVSSAGQSEESGAKPRGILGRQVK